MNALKIFYFLFNLFQLFWKLVILKKIIFLYYKFIDKKKIFINSNLFIFISLYEYHELEIKLKKDKDLLLESLEFQKYYFFSLILIIIMLHYAIYPSKFYKFILQFLQMPN